MCFPIRNPGEDILKQLLAGLRPNQVIFPNPGHIGEVDPWNLPSFAYGKLDDPSPPILDHQGVFAIREVTASGSVVQEPIGYWYVVGVTNGVHIDNADNPLCASDFELTSDYWYWPGTPWPRGVTLEVSHLASWIAPVGLEDASAWTRFPMVSFQLDQTQSRPSRVPKLDSFYRLSVPATAGTAIPWTPIDAFLWIGVPNRLAWNLGRTTQHWYINQSDALTGVKGNYWLPLNATTPVRFVPSSPAQATAQTYLHASTTSV